MSRISSGQIAAIHTLKARAGLDDASYRQLLETVAGVRSSTALTHAQAALVIDRLKGRSGPSQGPRALALHGPYVGICRALWIAGWNLGLVGQREDTALVAFVSRQTGLDHLNWLRDPADAAKVIEALKAWLARDAGVRWPSGADRDGTRRKRAVIAAQQRRLGLPEDVPAGDLDAVIVRLGQRVRRLPKAAGLP